MNTSKQKTRYVGIDRLRGWLIVFVMIGHIVLGSVYDNFIRYSIYAFHMPLFIGLAGYLINADALRRSSFIETLTRYWWRVVLPFAFAYLLFTGVLVFHAFEEGRITRPLLLSYIHSPYYHLWFIPTLVLWVLAFSALLKLRIPLLFALLFFLFTSLVWASMSKPDLLAELPSFIAALLSKKVIYFFGFFLFGAWLRTSNSRKFRLLFNDFKVLPVTLIMAFSALYLLNIGVERSLFRAFVWGVLNIALITFLIDMATSNIHAKSSIVSEIGRNSLPIYLWHVIPLFILKGFDFHQTHTLVYYFVGSISMLLITIAILRLEGKNKWIDRGLFGVV